MNIHQLSIEEGLYNLHSGPQGLSEVEAKRRLAEFGSNRVEKIRRESLIWQFLKEFTHFFAVILWVAAGLAFAADLFEPGHGMATLGLAIVGVILINGLFSFWQAFRASKTLEAMEKLLPRQARVLRDGVFASKDIEELAPGDVIAVEAGDLVPADCRLIEAFDLQVNDATVTGESVPKAKDAGRSGQEQILHSSNVVLAGTVAVTGNAKAVVFATGMQAEFGQIAHLAQTTGEVSFPLQKQIVFLSRVLAVLATVMGVVFFFVGQYIGLSFWGNFIFAIGIIVANVPEGLLPTVTLALAMGARRMARRNVLIRHLPAVETLGSTTVICTDKTGTLTENRMTVRTVFFEGHFLPGDEKADFSQPSEPYRLLLETALLCHNLKVTKDPGDKGLLGDPTEVALMQMARRAIPEAMTYSLLAEIPFDSDRKRMSRLYKTPGGKVLYTKGALEALLPLCSKVHTDNAVQSMTPAWQDRFRQAEQTMAAEGLRVLAMACRNVVEENYDRGHLEQDLLLLGLVGLHDPPRPEVPAAIQKCLQAGIKVILITGDHPRTAKAIAQQIGLVKSADPVVITGEELQHFSDIQLQLALDAPEILFARVAAGQKMQIVSALKRKGHTVAVTGDGVNDAPALKHADIGVAMGLAGTDVAREAADMVLTDNNFASIVAGIEEGRAVFNNIRKFLTYILTSNVPEIVPYLAFVLFQIPLALPIILILAVDLGTDMLPALALGAEKPEPEVMQRPPRRSKDRLLTWPLLFRAYLFLGVLEAIAAMSVFFFVLIQGGWRYGRDVTGALYGQATMACLLTIVITQVVNVFACRSPRKSTFAFGLGENKLILLGIAFELLLVLLIAYTPFGNMVFGTGAVGWQVWGLAACFGVGMLSLEEVRKWLLHRQSR